MRSEVWLGISSTVSSFFLLHHTYRNIHLILLFFFLHQPASHIHLTLLSLFLHQQVSHIHLTLLCLSSTNRRPTSISFSFSSSSTSRRPTYIFILLFLFLHQGFFQPRHPFPLTSVTSSFLSKPSNRRLPLVHPLHSHPSFPVPPPTLLPISSSFSTNLRHLLLLV